MDSTRIKNLNNAKEFEYGIQVTRWLLQIIGVWPLKSPRFPMALCLLVNALCLLNMIFFFVPCVMYAFFAETRFAIRMQCFGPIIFGFLSIFKYVVLTLKKRKMGACIIEMAVVWDKIDTAEIKDIMIKNSKTARFFTIVSLIFMVTSGTPFNIILPLYKEPIVIENVTHRHLTYPAYFGFFNPHVNPVYKYVFMSHCVTGIIMYAITSGVCGIVAICILHISSRCDIISLMFKRVANNFDNDLFVDIVQEHWRSLKFASKLEDILNEICLVEFIGTSINICLLGYYFLTTLKQSDVLGIITFTSFLFSLTFNIFIYCYIGQVLTEQCESIGTSAYMVNWHYLSPKDVRNWMFVITLTQRPIYLTAGKMMNLSIPSFSNIIKAAAAYLNMLRTIDANVN